MYTLRLLGGASLDGPDGPVTGRAGLRQRVALLTLLAVEHPHPVSRDRLVGYLWPESADGDARHLLRESLYILRSALGDDSVLSTGGDLRLNPDRLTCDLWEFEAALAREPEAAVRVYLGPFLNGFHLSDADEFERWAEAERSRLARRYGQALEQLAEREAREGDPLGAVEWWSRLAGEDPYNGRIALRYMEALEAAGDRAGALRHAKVHADLLRAELDTALEPNVVALAERLRLEQRAAPRGAPATPQPPSAAPVPPDDDTPESLVAAAATGPGRPTLRRRLLPAALVLALVLGLGLLGGTLSRARTPTLAPRRVAVAVFANHTGRPDLDDLGHMTADWIIRGLMETPLIDVTDLEAIYAREPDGSGGRNDPRALARRDGAGLVISGNYYRSGDSVLFQGSIVDVASGRVLRSFAPVGAPIEHTGGALEALREGVAGGLSALVNPAHRIFPVDPDMIPPPNFPAYREFIAGLRQVNAGDWEAESPHYRRSAELDSTFVAPLVQLATRAVLFDECYLTDSIGTALAGRRRRLTAWDRFTLDEARARCRGEMEIAQGLLRARLEAYPLSNTAQRRYVGSLMSSNRTKAAQEILRRLDPLDPWWGWAPAPEGYWGWMAVSHHLAGHYHAELEITDRWRDSAATTWPYIRGRALAAMGWDREVLELFQRLTAGPIDEVVGPLRHMASELAVHGHHRTATAVAESILVRLEAGLGDSGRSGDIAWANRLLGRTNEERAALERMVAGDADTTAKLDGLGRIAVLRGDAAEAHRIDSILAEQGREPLRSPWVRGHRLLARAHIAAGLGRREQAVARLREAAAQGQFWGGAFFEFHNDVLLAPLRGYPPFDALLQPDN